MPAVVAAWFIAQVHSFTFEHWVTIWVVDTEVSRVAVIHAVLIVAAIF